MGMMKRQVNNILDLWMEGYTFARIAKATGLTTEVVEYVINEYGEDVMPAVVARSVAFGHHRLVPT